MKMKRLFTLVLSLMMILSLSAPASAIDGENVYTKEEISSINFTRDLGNNKPCIFTYGAKFGSKSGGHAVLAVGYVETTKYQYLRIADGWNDYLRYINFNGYDYTRKDGWSFSVSK